MGTVSYSHCIATMAVYVKPFLRPSASNNGVIQGTEMTPFDRSYMTY